MSTRIERILEAPSRDLGDGFSVRRALPRAERRMVGPFVFVDQFGPTRMPPGHGLDVRPHPHIGLSTVTYLFEGEIDHRDSLGTVQTIRPGQVNWMTAGRGIVHSERTPAAERERGASLSGMQTWVALPEEHEEVEPCFAHHPEVPSFEESGARVTVVIGELRGARSPVTALSPTLYVDLELPAGASLRLPVEAEEAALYVAEGALRVGADRAEAGGLAVLEHDGELRVESDGPTRAMLLGGAHLGPRHVWWNLVSSRRERIEEAKRAWAERRFAPVPGDDERIPHPEE